MQLSVALLLLAPLLATSALASPPAGRGDRNSSIQQRQARSKDVADRLRRGRQRRQGAASPVPNVPTFTSTVIDATETAPPATVTVTVTAPAVTETSTPIPDTPLDPTTTTVTPVEPLPTTTLTEIATADPSPTDDSTPIETTTDVPVTTETNTAVPTETITPVEETPTTTATEDAPVTTTDAPVATPTIMEAPVETVTTTDAPVETVTVTLAPEPDETPTAAAIEPVTPTEVVLPVELLTNGGFTDGSDHKAGWLFSRTGNWPASFNVIPNYGVVHPEAPSDTYAAYFVSNNYNTALYRQGTTVTYAQASPATVKPGQTYVVEAKMSSRYGNYDDQNLPNRIKCNISVRANDLEIGSARPCTAAEPCTLPGYQASTGVDKPYRQYAFEFTPTTDLVTVAIVVDCPASTTPVINNSYQHLYFFDDISLKRAV